MPRHQGSRCCLSEAVPRRPQAIPWQLRPNVQIINVGRRLAREGEDDISFQQSGTMRRAVFFHGNHENSALGRQPMEPGDPARQWDILAGNANVSALDPPVFDKAAGYEFRRVGGNRKADSLGGKNYSGIHADNLSPPVDKRPTGIARVEGSIGLDNIVDQSSRGGTQRAPERTNHARRHRALEAVWIAEHRGGSATTPGWAQSHRRGCAFWLS